MNIKNKARLFVSLATVFIFPQFAAAQENPNASVEAIVRASFPDMPEMIGIAKCESGFRQFGPDGTPLRGGTGKRYIGIFQIGESLHRARALSMGYDINTIEGNIAYARYMYFASGTNPWKGCLGGAAPAPAPALPQPSGAVQGTVAGSISANLNFGMTNPQVRILQQILNKSGFTITASGAGSPGQETNYFGSLTREALKKFQCAKAIVCEGSESSTGFGRVGPRTRAALNLLR